MAQKIKYPVINGNKECGDCAEIKPISEFRKARNHYTSRCINCLRIYSKNYRNRPDIKKKTKEYHKARNKNPEKRKMKNEYLRKYRKGEKAKETRNKWKRQWSAKQKQKAVDYKGGKCIICGYNNCLAALEFHHKNPKEKDGYGTGALKSHWTFEKNKPELDKCILVCVRCHREIHAGVVLYE